MREVSELLRISIDGYLKPIRYPTEYEPSFLCRLTPLDESDRDWSINIVFSDDEIDLISDIKELVDENKGVSVRVMGKPVFLGRTMRFDDPDLLWD